MELLFKREQGLGTWGRVSFKLWGKLEPTEDEQALIDRYRLDEAVLIEADESHLLRGAVILGVIAFFIVGPLLTLLGDITIAVVGGITAGIGVGYWRINEKRETIFVKDLLHGRNFVCKSVVELAKKEAWLEGTCGVFRQVMESAKHWDGIERHTIAPLPKDQAKELIVRAA